MEHPQDSKHPISPCTHAGSRQTRAVLTLKQSSKLAVGLLVLLIGTMAQASWRIKCGNGNDDRLKALQVNAAAQPFGKQLRIEDHEAVFSFSIETDPGSQAPSAYAWSPARDEAIGSSIPADSVVVDGTGHAPTATGRVYATGEFIITCKITINGGPEEHLLELTVAVFGGPLDFTKHESVYYVTPPNPPQPGVGRRELETPDSVPWTTVDDDNGHYVSDQPHYANYFNRPPNQSYELYEQQPSYYVVTPHQQPGVTTYSWFKPAFLTDCTPTGILDSRTLKPNATGENGEVKCFFTCTYDPPDGDPIIKGPEEDTTDEAPVLSGRVTVRKPDHLMRDKSSLGKSPHDQNPPAGGLPGLHAAKLHDVLKLIDNQGTAMPGVKLTERFDPIVLPPGSLVNADHRGAGWETIFVNPATPSRAYTLMSGGWLDNGQVVSLKVSDGAMDTMDHLRYIWTSGDSATYSFAHTYWAGTLDTTPAETGVDVHAWTITLTPGAQLGDRGTVVHDP